jgi:glycosyltransferase involved in cell wall biosynthesis
VVPERQAQAPTEPASENGIQVFRIPIPTFLPVERYFSLFLGREAHRILRIVRPDIVHFAHGFFAPLLTLRKGLWGGQPVVWTIQNVPPEEHSVFSRGWISDTESWKQKLYESALKAYANSSLRFVQYDGLICVSVATREKAIAAGARRERTIVIPNGAEAAFFGSITRSDARATLGLPQDKLTVLTVAGIVPHKGLHVLLRAVAAVRESLRDVLFLIVGPSRSPAYASEIMRQASSLVEADVVRFVGSVPWSQMPLYHTAADLYVHPSFQEGCCISIFEAMAASRAVVATRTGYVPELAGAYGVIGVEIGSADALAAAILSTLKSANQLVEMGKRNRTLALEKHTWDTVAEETVKFYDDRFRSRTLCRSPPQS